MRSQARFFLPAGYRARMDPEYFVDTVQERGTIHQPDVYRYAAALGDRMGATWLIDIGCGRAGKLLPLGRRFQLFGIDHGENIRWCQAQQAEATWLEWDLANPEPLPIPEPIAANAVVICSDVIEHLRDPEPLVRNLVALTARSRAVVVSTPDRALARGPQDMGPPGNTSHVREWTLPELVQLFTARGAKPALAGLTRNNDQDSQKHTILLTFGRELEPPAQPAPAEFSVLAVVCTYNEADIVAPVLGQLVAQGVRVHVIDTWSTDDTLERVAGLAAGSDLVAFERFPAEAPAAHCEWGELLRRVEQVAATSTADWAIFQDADEIRRAPWPGTSLRDGIWRVDRAGYTLIDHTVVDFRPVDFSEYPGADPLEHFSHFEFGQHPAHFVQMKAWKRAPGVKIAASGGHRAEFDGARVYPLKFIDLHFPIRSQAHGRRKVLAERRERWSPEELAQGWHSHYDFVDESTVLVWDAACLHPYDPATFEQEYLTELVTGVNIPRVPNEQASRYGSAISARLLNGGRPG
jgi:SAM-dependent methyltransferase